MEPLKEMFGPVFYGTLSSLFKQMYAPFAAEKFLREVLAPLASLSLNERMRHTSVVLHQHLPRNYPKAIAIMREVVPLLPTGYTTLVFPDYVSQFGTHDFATSLPALHFFTRFGSSEFAVRTFLKLDFEQTIRHLYRWSEDANDHVRRLSSEGSRPRLPWSFKLDLVIQNPKHTKPILENLKKDESLYVRKSVANHLNDLSKDSPDYVLKLVQGWDKSHPHTAWVIKRGCRSLFKQGDKKSLALFSFTKDAKVAIKNLKLIPRAVRIGDALHFSFDLISTKDITQKLMVDYRIYYVKKTGVLSPKVFKLKEIDLKPNTAVSISKTQSFQDFTTRQHFAGEHKLEILANGEVVAGLRFLVEK